MGQTAQGSSDLNGLNSLKTFFQPKKLYESMILDTQTPC